MDRLSGLDLFSGIGGITKALDGYVTPVAYCENDRYAQAVLLSRMADGQLPTAPIWDDVTSLRGSMLPGGIDIIYGGFPCQDISVAGRGAGLEGKRSGLFFEIARLVGELRPRFIFLENVPAIARRGGNAVVGTLADLGYDCRWDVLSAADVGANHLRERWWLLAHTTGLRRPTTAQCQGNGEAPKVGKNDFAGDANNSTSYVADATGRQDIIGGSRSVVKTSGGREGVDAALGNGGEDVADSKEQPERTGLRQDGSGGKRRGRSGYRGGPDVLANSDRPGREEQRSAEPNGAEHEAAERRGWWVTEPNVGRVAHGIPQRVDRLRALGNSVVAQCAREAFERLIGIK